MRASAFHAPCLADGRCYNLGVSELAAAGYLVAPEKYLIGERLGETKHEYLAGVVYAMAGTTVNHDRIAGNIYRELGNQLRGRPCEPFTSDIKVRVESAGALFYYYPDVTVDCSNVQGSSLFAEQPRVVFEVMSPETERIDRGEKLRNYQALPSLQHYVLVDQFHRLVTVYRKDPENSWTSIFLEGDAALDLPDLGCRLPLTAMYERAGVQ
jgi:Uma2 family endonuclease